MLIQDQSGEGLSDDGRYRLLVEAVTDYAIYMLDPAGIVSSWNPGARRFKGYTAQEIIGQHFSRFYTQEDLATSLPARALETARTTGKFEAEGWRVRKDGSRFWAYVVIDPIKTPDGELIGYAKITRDLTERRKSEEQLRQSEEQFRLLVQGVTDYAIYMLDPQGNVSNWNPGAQRIKGYAPEEIIGSHFSQFYTPEDRANEEPQKALATARREGKFEKEGWRIRKDGTRFWAHVIIDPIRNEMGELIGYAKITRDITERKEAQQRLDSARDALIQSQKIEAIGQLTGGVAHDFNNLLMVVLSSLELMRKRLPDDPRLHALLKNAVEGAQRGATLTKRMLAFARRQDLKQEAVDISDLVRGMTDMLSRTLGPAMRIETRFPLLSPPVLADANQLEMAVLNLTVNARDAMPDGGEIVIASKEYALEARNEINLPAGRYVCLTVSDSGTGMDAETVKRSMEPFFTTKGIGKGTGLGLSMVHGLAQQSGGQLKLRSKVGEGTTAELWMPVATGRKAVETEVTPVPARSRSELNILAVDDDVLVLTNTVAVLEDLGHVVFSATSAMKALEMIRSEPGIELVITDHAMPHMTGLQLTEAIRKEWPDIVVILATGYAELDGARSGNIPKLSKPFSEAELNAEIVRILPKTKSGGRVVQFKPPATQQN